MASLLPSYALIKMLYKNSKNNKVFQQINIHILGFLLLIAVY